MTSETKFSATPPLRLNLAITGHRQENHKFAANRDRILAVLIHLFDEIGGYVEQNSGGNSQALRVHSLLANGADQMVAQLALDKGWELVCPLPFGRVLNEAINALPATLQDAEALLAGKPAVDPFVAGRACAISTLTQKAQLFELADQDDKITKLFLDKLANPTDFSKATTFVAETSLRVALAGQILVEQSDLVIGIWDGATTAHLGGTGHTIASALDLGTPVLWIDPAAPEDWRILRVPESLISLQSCASEQNDDLARVVRDCLVPNAASSSSKHAHSGKAHPGHRGFEQEKWHKKSNILSHAYRRVEALFDGSGRPFRNLTQVYERPEEIANGSAKPIIEALNNLPDHDRNLADAIATSVLKTFAWADGVSVHLSDAYRGGMTINFVLSALAIVGGISYLPFSNADAKWMFAGFEFLLLVGILIITFLGNHKRWHGRWFETRRLAEYLRHSPLLLALGVARGIGHWPRGTETSWPEWYARHLLRDVGLPKVAITSGYLKAVLATLLNPHIIAQRDYHLGKAKKLTTVHKNLDACSEFLFQMAVGSVAIYLLIKALTFGQLIGPEFEHHVYKLFTFFGVLLPTFGASIAGIRYFGDFERFAAISEITAEKLGTVHDRIEILLQAPDGTIDFAMAADLAHAADSIVVSEIENWQSVFGGKHISVPV